MIIFETSYSRELVEDSGGVRNLIFAHPTPPIEWAAANNIHCRIDWQKKLTMNGIKVQVEAFMTPEQETEFILRFT